MREGYGSRPVCVCICPSVAALAASASAYTCSQRCSGVCHRLFLDNMCGFTKKTSVQKLWRKKANMQMVELTASGFRAVSGPTKHSSYVKGNWWVECGQATGVKQARYRRGPTRGQRGTLRACAV